MEAGHTFTVTFSSELQACWPVNNLTFIAAARKPTVAEIFPPNILQLLISIQRQQFYDLLAASSKLIVPTISPFNDSCMQGSSPLTLTS